MFLAELVLQGVRGIRGPARLRFKAGYNLVIAGNESGKTTAVDTVHRLLFPSGNAAALDLLISRHTPDASRSALVLCSNDGDYYRIIQDFSKRAVNISQYNPASKDFRLLHRDWDSAAQFMAEMTAGMSPEDFARIFVFHREQHTARSGTVASAAAQRPAPGPVTSTPAPQQGRQSSGNQERLVELRESLRKAEEAADAEYKYQAVKLALEENRKKIASLDEMGRKIAEMDSSIESLKAYRDVPGDLAALIEAQERRSGQKTVDADELNKHIEAVQVQLASLPIINIFTDKLFLSGIAMVFISIIAGVFLLTEELKLLFPLGLLLSLFLMAGAWYKGSRITVKRKTYQAEEEHLLQELAELEKRFQQEGETVTDCMRSTGASSLAELKEKAENYRYFLSMRSDLEEQQKRSLGDLAPEILQQQCERQQQELGELEKAAQELAPYNIDTYGIRQDIERLEGQSAAASASTWDFSADTQDLPAEFADFAADDGHGGFHAELSIASRIGEIEMETLVPAVEAAAQRNLAAITAGRYVRIEAGHEGDPIVHAKDDSTVAFSHLSHGTRSLIYFCLRTGLVEALAGKKRFPFILDDALADFDPLRQKAACQVLRALGAKTQVILLTSNPLLRAEGDVALELK